MNKITLSPKFIRKRIPPEAKWFLIEILSTSEDFKLPLDTYTNILAKYLKLYPHDDVSKYTSVRLYYQSDNLIHFLPEALKKEGIGFRMPNNYKPVDVDPEKVTRLMFAYNRARTHYYMKIKHFVIPPLVAKPSILGHCKATVDFLDANDIQDWEVYFFALFIYHGWNRVLSLIHCHSPECLDKYNNCRIKALRELEQIKISNEKVEEKSIWVDTYGSVEDRKRQLLDEATSEVCLNNIEETLGYHPQSLVCQSCPLAGECKDRINKKFREISKSDLDITDVRGRIVSVEEAERRVGFKFYP